ncbi:MAG: hypothetical protein IIB60_04635 [Planctomycetes bacterium]|nr:hypothetical protein [Planctomycetota bacterium]
MIFFTDENISSKIAPLLEAFDPTHQIRSYENYFEEGVPDTTWIGEIAKWSEKPAVLCGDGRILTNPAELAALREANLMFVVLGKRWTDLNWPTFAWKIIKVWPQIVQEVHTTRRPTLFRVTVKNLKVELVRAISELRGRS